MTVEQIACVCIGVIVQAATFALGILVGCSMRVRRKESSHAKACSRVRCPDAFG